MEEQIKMATCVRKNIEENTVTFKLNNVNNINYGKCAIVPIKDLISIIDALRESEKVLCKKDTKSEAAWYFVEKELDKLEEALAITK